jgi:tetratricopeptide (TPR) repeat protein
MAAMSYQEYQRLLKQEQYPEAARYAEQQAEDQAGSSGDSEAFWLTQQARALNRAGEHAAALEPGRRALDRSPENPFAVAATADALFGLQRLEKALAHYQELLASPRLLQQGRKVELEALPLLEELRGDQGHETKPGGKGMSAAVTGHTIGDLIDYRSETTLESIVLEGIERTLAGRRP